MPLNDPDKIDISLSLLGAEDQGAVQMLMQRLADLDNRLKNMAAAQPGQADQAVEQWRLANQTRVIPTGSVSAPNIRLPSGSIYNPSGTGPVSPISETNLRTRAKQALGIMYRGVPEGESSTQDVIQGAKNRFIAASEHMLGGVTPALPSHGFPRGSQEFGARRRPTMGADYAGGLGGGGNFGGGGGPGAFAGDTSGGESLPPDASPSNVPNWMLHTDRQRAYTPMEVPRYGELTTQNKLELASDWFARRAYRNTDIAASAAGQQAYQSTYEAALANKAIVLPSDTRAAEQAAQEAAQTAATQSAIQGGGLSGQSSAWLNWAANRSAAVSALSSYGAAAGHLMFGTQDVSFVDPSMLDPKNYIIHAPTMARNLQAMGQQMGYQAGNEDVGLAWKHIQNPLNVQLQDEAAKAAQNMILQALAVHQRYSRVTTQQAGEFEMAMANEGFSGVQGNAVLRSAAGVMQQTGVSAGVLAPIYAQELRYGTGSLDEVATSLSNIGSAAKVARQSLDVYVEGLNEFAQDAIQNRGAITPASAISQGRSLTDMFPGLNPQDVQGLANNPMVRMFATMNTGLLPFQQGSLPGVAIGQATQQAMAMAMQATGGFARATTIPTPFGNIQTSARNAHIQAAAHVLGIPVPEAEALMRNPQKQYMIGSAQGVISTYLDPNSGQTNINPYHLLTQVYNAHLGVSAQKYQQLYKEGPRRMMTDLQSILEKQNQASTTGQQIPGATVTLYLAQEAAKTLAFDKNGKKKSTKIDLSRQLAQAGGYPSAQMNLDPVQLAQLGQIGR